jgi:hypothetical protein
MILPMRPTVIGIAPRDTFLVLSGEEPIEVLSKT